MARPSMNPIATLNKTLTKDHSDFLRDAVEAVVRELMEVEVSRLTNAAHGERSPEDRATQRNGYRVRRWDTRVGSIELAIPKVRKGSYFPSFLEPRRRSEHALLNVIQEAYINGVSTRRVEDVMQALGVDGVSKSEVSRICGALDEQVEEFRERPLTCAYPYVWFDAKVEKVREGGRVVSTAVVVAYGVNEEGYREVLGVNVGACETEEFWTEFLRSLVARGLRGVSLAISDCHLGLKAAIAKVLTGASWQRCTVHFMRNILARVPKQAGGMVAAAVRMIFLQPDVKAAKEQLGKTAAMLQDQFPEVAKMLYEAEEDILAHMHFPQAHWRQIRSTNPLERLNKEIGRRTDVVGIFPNRAALLRLVTMVLAEQNDEWQVGRRYLSLESLAQLNPVKEPVPTPLPAAA